MASENEKLHVMTVKDIGHYLDSTIPLSYQESYDNSGFQTGDAEKEISSALISLDITDDVLNEAISTGCGLIITHHPLIFNGLKKFTGKTFVERLLIKALKNDIAIYSAHTNLDVLKEGVSNKMAQKLGLKNIRILSPLKNKLLKLVVYVPEDQIEQVREAVFDAGAGFIGNYDKCSFSSRGNGSFRAGDNANPFAGKKGKIHFEKEIRFETVILSHMKDKIIKAMIKAHPYEEVAYDLYAIENDYNEAGMGCVGELDGEMKEKEFLEKLSFLFNSKGIRYSGLSGKTIKKIAMCGGAGISLLNESLSLGADAFVTSDIKYHNFFEADNKILLVDIGHFESEKFSQEILYDLIIKKFPKFAVRFSETNTNPINYL
jgi:dinuclear metal center YbgI/SA1388 family protein